MPNAEQYESPDAIEGVWIIFCQMTCDTPALGPFRRSGPTARDSAISVASRAAHRAGWANAFAHDKLGQIRSALGWVCPSCLTEIARARRKLPKMVATHDDWDADVEKCAAEGHVPSRSGADFCGRCFARTHDAP